MESILYCNVCFKSFNGAENAPAITTVETGANASADAVGKINQVCRSCTAKAESSPWQPSSVNTEP